MRCALCRSKSQIRSHSGLMGGGEDVGRLHCFSILVIVPWDWDGSLFLVIHLVHYSQTGDIDDHPDGTCMMTSLCAYIYMAHQPVEASLEPSTTSRPSHILSTQRLLTIHFAFKSPLNLTFEQNSLKPKDKSPFIIPTMPKVSPHHAPRAQSSHFPPRGLRYSNWEEGE